ncbi:MAG: hypothetical protein KGZ80_04585 [Methylomonas sp.]|nr:hypothetical protein [Methylomonas sp.]
MSKNNNLTQQLVSVLQEMVNDYGYNRCDEKRLETIGEAKNLLDKARQSMPDSSVIDPALAATISDLKAVYASTTKGQWDVEPQGIFVIDRSDINLNEIVQVMNKGAAFTTVEAEANLIFIAQAHNAMPFLIDEIERLYWLEAELDQAKNHTNQLMSLLQKSSQTMSSMREQIEQMRPMFDDEDGAIQYVCDSHDELLSTFVDLGSVA